MIDLEGNEISKEQATEMQRLFNDCKPKLSNINYKSIIVGTRGDDNDDLNNEKIKALWSNPSYSFIDLK